MSKIALIDFKDSFTYNIYHYLLASSADVTVFEDGKFDLGELDSFEKIVLSPGPGLPIETTSLFAILNRFGSNKAILGICLGMQGIVEHFGGAIFNQTMVKHGVKTSMNVLESCPLFEGLPQNFSVGLYHSWACNIDKASELTKIAESEEGVVMAIQHQTRPVFGLQFHPESILTDYGKDIVANFVHL